MADEGRGFRGQHLLTTLLVIVVVGLAAILAGLKYGRGGGKGASATTPDDHGKGGPGPNSPPKDDKRALKERLRKLREEARAAMQDRDAAGAYEAWREAHELAPDDADIATEFDKARLERDFQILFEQGEAALGKFDHDQALVYYEKALELRPATESITPEQLKGKIRFCHYAIALREGQEAAKKEDWKGAVEKFNKALSFNEGQLAKDGLADAKKHLEGATATTQNPPNPEVPPTSTELQAKVKGLQDKINELQKDNHVESFQEAAALCDDLATVLKGSPDLVAKVGEQKKMILEKGSGYEKLYSKMLEDAQAALKAGEAGRALALAEQFRGKYKKNTKEIDTFIDECHRESVVTDVVLVPEGIYEVGSDDPIDQNPRGTHTVNAIFIDRREVTNQQYKAFVDATGYRWPRYWSEGRYPQGLERYPVMGVAWVDAANFAKWAGKRLPSEAEWEVAASGGAPRRYPWGETFVADNANTLEKGATGPTMVGSHPDGKSPFGALDLIGNVAEWTSSTTPDPDDPSRTLRIAKGGSFLLGAAQCTISARDGQDENLQLVGYGFRCVTDATPEAIEKYKKEHASAGSDETSHK